jgi:hypothetical protein
MCEEQRLAPRPFFSGSLALQPDEPREQRVETLAVAGVEISV